MLLRESPPTIKESHRPIRESPASSLDKSLDYSMSSQTQVLFDASTSESPSMIPDATPPFPSLEPEILWQQAQNTVQDDLFSQSTAEFNKSCDQIQGTFEAWWKTWNQPLSEDSSKKKKPKKTKRQQLLQKAKQAKAGATPNIVRSPTFENVVPENRTVWLEGILSRLRQPPIFSSAQEAKTEDAEPRSLPEEKAAQVTPDPNGPPGRRTFTC